MQLSEQQASWVTYALRALISERQLSRKPVPAELVALHQHLVTFADESPTAGDSSSLSHDRDWINAAEAAEILSRTPCRVRQIRADLGGQRCPCGQGWVFDRRDVIEYAAAKDAGTGSG